MPNNELIKFFPITLFLVFLMVSFLLNYVSALYSEADLFKIDLTKRRKSKKIKKLIFVLKNGQLLSATISFSQVFINFFMSLLATKMLKENKKLWEKIPREKGIYFFLISLFIALFSEILVRFLAAKKFSKRMVLNHHFINFAYFISRLSFFQFIIKPRKRIFVNSENDVSLFVSNLAAEKILEKKEAKLIQSALNFDEIKVRRILTKWAKVICLENSLDYEGLKRIYLKHFLDRYPVINKKKQLVGIFSMKMFFREGLLKNKNSIWQDYINKEFITVRPQDKLDKVFEKLQNNYCYLAIVKNGRDVLGIITLQDTLNALVGKMKDEKDKIKQTFRSAR